MMDYLRGMMQRAATVAVVLVGAVFAIVMTTLAVTVALVLGLFAWIAARIGLRRRPPASAQPPSEVIDIEMREIPERREHDR